MAEKVLRTHYTYEDYAGFPDDGKRYEIIGGDLFVTPAPTVEHQDLSARLHLHLAAWVSAGAGGKLLYAPVDVHLTPDTIVQPDLMWIAPARVTVLVSEVIRGAPDLVIEILSPRTSRVDRTLKRDAYALHGVREYWLVDPQARSVTILRTAGESFVEHGSGSGDQPIHSSIDEQLQLVPARLFAIA